MQQGRPPIKASLLPKLIGPDATFTPLHSSSDPGTWLRLACSVSPFPICILPQTQIPGRVS